MRLLPVILLLTLCGCAAMEHNAFISPSDALYYKADRLFENQDFTAAIALYEEFIKTKPRSSLAVPARLNLGMSHYYQSDYKEAYSTLREISIKDENIKKYVERILAKCKAQAGDAIKAQEKAPSAAKKKTSAGEIKIDVIDAYLDDFGSVVLKGKLNRPATVVVNGGRAAALDANNIFVSSSRWKKGDSILITANDKDGNSSELDYFPDGESPDKPERLRVINTTSNSVEIEWDKNEENDIKGYRLFYRLKGGSSREIQEVIENTRYEIIGLQDMATPGNKTFEFYLRAIDKMNNESDNSDLLEGTLP